MADGMELGIKLKADPAQLKAGLEDARQAILKTYGDAKDGVGAAEVALKSAQAEAQAMARSLAAADAPSEKLVENFEAARAAVNRAKEAVIQQTLAMQEARAAAKANAEAIEKAAKAEQKFEQGRESRAKIDSANKAAAAEAKAAAAARQQFATDRNALGLSAHKDVEAQINEVKAAYERLKTSGKLTSTELAQAAMRTNERINELRVSTNGWSESLMKAKVAIAGVVASGSGLAYVARASMGFETSMVSVAKVVDGTDEQIKTLSKSLKDMAQSMPVEGGLNGLTAIAAAGGQLGIPIERLREFTELTAKMASAFNMSAEAAGQSIARMMNVYDLPLERIRELGDAVNVLGNTMATSEGEIVEVMTRIGGGARQFGLSAEQAAALAAAFTALGKPAMVAGTAINALLSKLQTANIQGGEFQKALAGIGLSGEKLAQDIEDNPQAALTAFLQTLSRLEGRQRSEVLSQLFGMEYQDDIALLVGSLGQYESALGRVGDKTQTVGALQAEYGKQADTSAAKLQILKQSFETLAVALGDAIMPILEPLIQGLGSLTAALAWVAEELPIISGIAEALLAGALAAGGLKTAFLALGVAKAKVFASLTAQIVAMNVELRASVVQVGLLKTAMLTMGGALTAAIAGWEIGTSLRENFVEVEQMGIALMSGLHKSALGVGAAFKAALSPLHAREIFADLEKELQELDNGYAELFADAQKHREPPKPVAPVAAKPVDEAQKATAALAKSLKDARQAAQELGVDLSQFSNEVSPEFKEVETNLDKLIAAFDQLKASGIDTGAALNDALGKALAKAKNPADLAALVERINALGESGKLARPKMLDLFNAIKDKASEAGGEAKKLQDDISALIEKANSIRSGKSGYGAKAAEARNAGKSPEQVEAEALRQAQKAADDARYYSAASKAAALDGRAEKAAEYAKKAKTALDEADAAAGRITDSARKARIFEDLADAQANAAEAEAIAKQRQLDDMRTATEAQEQQLAQLETRVDALIAKAQTGMAINVDTAQAQPAVDAIKAGIDAIPTEKTVTINIVENRMASAAAAIPAFASGGLLDRAAAAEALPRASNEASSSMVPAVFNIPNVGRVPVNMAQNVAADLAHALEIENLMRGKR